MNIINRISAVQSELLLDDREAIIVNVQNLSLTYNDGTNTIELEVIKGFQKTLSTGLTVNNIEIQSLADFNDAMNYLFSDNGSGGGGMASIPTLDEVLAVGSVGYSKILSMSSGSDTAILDAYSLIVNYVRYGRGGGRNGTRLDSQKLMFFAGNPLQGTSLEARNIAINVRYCLPDANADAMQLDKVDIVTNINGVYADIFGTVILPTAIGNLQQTLDAGNTANNSITVGAGYFIKTSYAVGYGDLEAGLFIDTGVPATFLKLSYGQDFGANKLPRDVKIQANDNGFNTLIYTPRTNGTLTTVEEVRQRTKGGSAVLRFTSDSMLVIFNNTPFAFQAFFAANNIVINSVQGNIFTSVNHFANPVFRNAGTNFNRVKVNFNPVINSLEIIFETPLSAGELIDVDINFFNN